MFLHPSFFTLFGWSLLPTGKGSNHNDDDNWGCLLAFIPVAIVILLVLSLIAFVAKGCIESSFDNQIKKLEELRRWSNEEGSHQVDSIVQCYLPCVFLSQKKENKISVISSDVDYNGYVQPTGYDDSLRYEIRISYRNQNKYDIITEFIQMYTKDDIEVVRIKGDNIEIKTQNEINQQRNIIKDRREKSKDVLRQIQDNKYAIYIGMSEREYFSASIEDSVAYYYNCALLCGDGCMRPEFTPHFDKNGKLFSVSFALFNGMELRRDFLLEMEHNSLCWFNSVLRLRSKTTKEHVHKYSYGNNRIAICYNMHLGAKRGEITISKR